MVFVPKTHAKNILGVLEFFTNIWYLPAPKRKYWFTKTHAKKQNLLWCFTMYITNNIWYLLGTNLETLVKVKTSFKRNLCKSMCL